MQSFILPPVTLGKSQSLLPRLSSARTTRPFLGGCSIHPKSGSRACANLSSSSKAGLYLRQRRLDQSSKSTTPPTTPKHNVQARSYSELSTMVKGGITTKVPKGTRDWSGTDIVIREKIFDAIKSVFVAHGGVTIDTPVFELKEILAGKYGEDSKLIYDLKDQGGEISSLRYDLTVPFARFLAMNKDIQNIKRYHIAKVYRRDQPAMTKGRMREFYQCDFDIAGIYDPMIPDAEILKIVCQTFDSLPYWKGTYTIKLNHRSILDGIFSAAGVPDDKIRTISSAVDKLDKMPWEEVRKEMTVDKGLDEEAADRIGKWVVKKGGRELLEVLQADEQLASNESIKKGIADLTLLFEYLECFGVLEKVSFDLSLARGLDYYTGLIYEVITEGSAPPAASGEDGDAKASKKKGKKSEDDDRSDDPTIGVGSVAAGGRYDGLVSMFSGSKNQLPCVGISFGVDRIFSITKARMAADKNAPKVRNNEVDVYVMAFGSNGYLKERMKLCAQLWDAGIKTETLYKAKPKLPAQFKAAEANAVPFALFLGEDEVAQNKVKIKEMGLSDGHPEKEGVLVDQKDMVAELKTRLQRKQELDLIAQQAGGLKVVDGVKGEEVDTTTATTPAPAADGANPAA